ncbi:glycosyltransferase family 2 protein [Rathayibacter sp. YIM 133350]|uniref:glycosyltransferase family 2 protein n=1 Tax=Rathayibacter sp. YIM 133350 TaxID=3131992 RepID=UPI00307D473A
MSGSVRVGVVIISHNSTEFLADCLESLAAEPINRVIVWDNASTREQASALSILCEGYPSVQLELSEENVGFGPAVNSAAARLRDAGEVDYLWILNPDVVVRAGALARLVRTAVDDDWAVLSPMIVRKGRRGDVRVWYSGGELRVREGRSRHIRIGEPLSPADTGVSSVSFVSGAAPLISVAAWDRLGGFREDLFLYCEDADLSLRATEHGLPMGVDREAVVEHVEGGSSGGHGPGPTFYYYVQRNRFRVYADATNTVGLLLGRGAIETFRLLVLTLRPAGRNRIESLSSSVQGLIAGIRGESGPRPSRSTP